MKTNTVWKSFLSSDQTLALSHRSENWAYYHLILTIQDDVFAEHIKDICIDAISPLLDSLGQEYVSMPDIEALLEHSLQDLNQELSLFSEENNMSNYLTINGALVVSYQGNILVSLIWRSSLLIARGGKSIYNMSNSPHTSWSISQFADYISGTVHSWDSLLIVGFDYASIFHNSELHELAQLIQSNQPNMLEDLENIIASRIENEDISYISLVRNISQTIDFSWIRKKTSPILNYIPRGALNRAQSKAKNLWAEYSYGITIGILLVVVVFSIYGVINSALNHPIDDSSIKTSEWIEIISIDDIKKEINEFERLDAASSNEKWKRYKIINDKLEFLKSKNKRPEDVAALQKILQDKYYEGFNIIAVNKLWELDGEFATSYNFTEKENKTLGSPRDLFYNQGLYVAWNKGAIIRGISEDVKWTSVSYALANDMKACTLDLPEVWLYCFDDSNRLYRVTADSVTPFVISENISLPTDIKDIGTFWRNNIYLMINPQTNGGVNLIERFTLQAWNYAWLGTQLGYKYQTSWSGGNSFSSMTIDRNFLLRNSSTQQLHQMQRDPATNNLQDRIINLEWGDTSFVTYSEDVKILTTPSSRYVYLFDRKNSTLTAYLSSPLKTTQGNELRYNLNYIMRYAFDDSLRVQDVAIAWSNQNILYVLTEQGVYETNIAKTMELYL